jgi:serine/threonine-protein phosphatase Stp1
MGGHQHGDVASQLIVRSIAGLTRHVSLEDRVHGVRQCLLSIHQKLGVDAAIHGPFSAIGSTVVALLIEEHRAACVWAGDSRCYLWRDQRLYQLSRDHTLLQRLLDEEHMNPEQAAQHQQAHALTRAVGGRNALDLEVIELNIQKNDVFLLSSDGLHQALDHKVLGTALNMQSPQAALSCLFDSALRGPADDNLTAVVIHT